MNCNKGICFEGRVSALLWMGSRRVEVRYKEAYFVTTYDVSKVCLTWDLAYVTEVTHTSWLLMTWVLIHTHGGAMGTPKTTCTTGPSSLPPSLNSFQLWSLLPFSIFPTKRANLPDKRLCLTWYPAALSLSFFMQYILNRFSLLFSGN